MIKSLYSRWKVKQRLPLTAHEEAWYQPTAQWATALLRKPKLFDLDLPLDESPNEMTKCAKISESGIFQLGIIIGQALLIFGRFINASIRFLWRAIPKYFQFLYSKGSSSRQHIICSSSKSAGNIQVYFTSLVAATMSPGHEIHLIISRNNHTTTSFPMSI
jgi:hypothetical protein